MTLPRQRTEKEALKLAETVLKKQNFVDGESKGPRVPRKTLRQKKAQAYRAEQVKPLDLFIRKSQRRRMDARRLKRRAGVQKSGQSRTLEAPETAPILLAVRNTEFDRSPAADAELKRLRLERFHTAVVLENTRENMHKLALVKSFVWYGAPSVDTLRRLIHTRGAACAVKGDESAEAAESAESAESAEPKALSSNLVVEELFGEFGALCIEDVVSCITQRQEGFEKVLRMLSPMKLENIEKLDGVKPRKRAGWVGDFDEVVSQVL